MPRNLKNKPPMKSLRAIILLWFLVFVFSAPSMIQLAHQFEHNNHGHNEMHHKKAIHYHASVAQCGIFSFEFSSFQKDILIKSFQVMSLQLFQQNVCIENETLACPTFLLPLLRGPPF